MDEDALVSSYDREIENLEKVIDRMQTYIDDLIAERRDDKACIAGLELMNQRLQARCDSLEGAYQRGVYDGGEAAWMAREDLD